MKLRLGIFIFFTIFLLAGCDRDKAEPDKATVSTPTTPTPQTDKQTGTQLKSNTNPTGDLGLEDVTKSQEEFIPATTDEDDNPEAVSEEELEASSEQIQEEFTQNDPEMADDPEIADDPEMAEDVVVNPQEVPEQPDVVNPEEPDQTFVNPEK